jgi:hypothetical protein
VILWSSGFLWGSGLLGNQHTVPQQISSSQNTVYTVAEDREESREMMSRLSLCMAMLAVLPTSQLAEALSQQNSQSSRRSFVAKVPALVGSAATMGWFVNFNAHEEACPCHQCAHGASCPCNSCAPSFRPNSAAAYERDVGGASPSAVTAAFNIQVRRKKNLYQEIL